MSLFLHDRKHEIGIYLALGEKRAKIMMQILAEVATITFVAMSLALFVGNQVSNMMTREMLRVEVLMPREREHNGSLMRLGFMQSAPDIYPEELMEIFDVSLDKGAIIIFYTIGLGTVILSTIVPIFYVTRLNPKKVLM
jgi:putative ABC transport system permease protein